jgi:hypothetical protein
MPDRPTFSQRQRTIDVGIQFVEYRIHVVPLSTLNHRYVRD